eukprot:m.76210 g.76210  ORF g.76210 m.76210 type:complete len:231 (-) comp12481_c0_seq7:107-799(-)
MTIFNADGTCPEACGNATRCVGSLLLSKQPIGKQQRQVSMNTPAGILLALPCKGHSLETRIKVTMPPLQVGHEANGIRDVKQLTADVSGYMHGLAFHPIQVISIGNPHCVIVLEEGSQAVPQDRLREVMTTAGGVACTHETFTAGANVEFVTVTDRNHIRMSVWERGVGPTLACGSGACAAVAACVHLGLTADTNVAVDMEDGCIVVSIADGIVWQEGPVALVFTGVWRS